MQKHGKWDGIIKATRALDYYQGLSLGKHGLTPYALIDAQLKAAGFPGIWPDRIEETDETGSMEEATKATEEGKYDGSLVSLNNINTNLEERSRAINGEDSAWNEPAELPGYLIA